MSLLHPTQYRFRHYRPDVGLIWASDGDESREFDGIPIGSKHELRIKRESLWTPNALADEGEKDILDVYFDDVAVRTSLFLRLYNDTPVETDTLATLVNETSGTGYGPITVTRGTDWTDPALDAGDMQTVMSTKQFAATGAWTAATHLVLATVGTGTGGLLIAYVALAATRTLANGDTLDIDLAIKLA